MITFIHKPAYFDGHNNSYLWKYVKDIEQNLDGLSCKLKLFSLCPPYYLKIILLFCFLNFQNEFVSFQLEGVNRRIKLKQTI